MGASGWFYFTPYRSFTNQALQELRQRVFENREYEDGPGKGEDLEAGFEPMLAELPPEERARKLKGFKVAVTVMQLMKKMQTGSLKPLAMREIMTMANDLTQGEMPDEEFDSLHAEFEARAKEVLGEASARPKPKSIDALLKKCGENGTHSILDIDHISDEPEFGAAAPMPEEMIEELYGSLEPTRQDIEKAQDHDDDLERWQAWYVVVYKDGRPHEIYFTGCSGD